MSKLRVHAFTISLDGYGAGPDQNLDNPLGVGGEALHEWVVPTRTFRKMFGKDGGETGVDDDFAARGFENIGAWIMGRNMFGPVRGAVARRRPGRAGGATTRRTTCPVFVLTHHARAPLAMEGGTTFHFVTDGIEAALERAREAAGGQDVRLGGGVGDDPAVPARAAGRRDAPRDLAGAARLGRSACSPASTCRRSATSAREHVPTAKATHVVLTKRG